MADLVDLDTWRLWRDRILVTCPSCQRDAAALDHAVDAEGRLSPSVICPHEGCDFHAMCHLVGWEESVDRARLDRQTSDAR